MIEINDTNGILRNLERFLNTVGLHPNKRTVSGRRVLLFKGACADMQLNDKIETYLLLCLERYILELRQQQWIGRETSRRVLKWVDAKLASQCGHVS